MWLLCFQMQNWNSTGFYEEADLICYQQQNINYINYNQDTMFPLECNEIIVNTKNLMLLIRVYGMIIYCWIIQLLLIWYSVIYDIKVVIYDIKIHCRIFIPYNSSFTYNSTGQNNNNNKKLDNIYWLIIK